MDKKRKIYIWIFSILFVSLTGSISYIEFPPIAAKIYAHRSFSDANLKIKKIKISGETFTYAEGGKGPTLLFVHGFQGDKHFWVKYAKPFTSSYHVVIPDLPGHGDSSCSKDQKFDLNSLAYFLDEFAKAKKLDKFQLIGTSLGAGVCMKYSAFFQEKVVKLLLLNPIGLRPFDENEYKRRVEANKKIFFPSTIKELDDLYIYLTGSPLPYNTQFKKYILNYLLKKKSIFEKAFKDFVSGEGVENELPKIFAPTLIINGIFDQVSKPTDLEIYNNNIQKCSSIVLNNGYHVFKGEAFEKALIEMEKFIIQ